MSVVARTKAIAKKPASAENNRMAAPRTVSPSRPDHGLRSNRLLAQPPLQVVCQVACRGIAPTLVSFQAFQADGVQIPGKIGADPARRGWFLRPHLIQGFLRSRTEVGRPAGQQLIEDGAQGGGCRSAARSLRRARALVRATCRRASPARLLYGSASGPRPSASPGQSR